MVGDELAPYERETGSFDNPLDVSSTPPSDVLVPSEALLGDNFIEVPCKRTSVLDVAHDAPTTRLQESIDVAHQLMVIGGVVKAAKTRNEVEVPLFYVAEQGGIITPHDDGLSRRDHRHEVVELGVRRINREHGRLHPRCQCPRQEARPRGQVCDPLARARRDPPPHKVEVRPPRFGRDRTCKCVEIAPHVEVFNLLAMSPEDQARWVEERRRRGIKGRLLALPSEQANSKKVQDQSELRETRILKLAIFDASFQIFGKKAILWQPLAPLALLIEDECIVTMLKAIFEGYWGSATAA